MNLGRAASLLAALACLGATACAREPTVVAGGSVDRIEGAAEAGSSPPIRQRPAIEVDRPSSIRLALTGDVLTHSPLWRQATRNAGWSGFDFRPMWQQVQPGIVNADLAICHLETPIAPAGEQLSTSPYYGVPVEVVDGLAYAGFHRCSTASNHSADRGVAGVERTVDALEAAGIGQSGMARTPDEIEPAVFEVRGVAFSHLSYTWSYNGVRFPDDQPWRSALIDPARILADARTARSLGAEVVIVSMHWGVEGVSTPSDEQRRVAAAITAEGTIDLVVGHHAHVVQPIERVNGTWVLFGLGNILSNLPTGPSWPAATQDAVIATVDVNAASDGNISIGRPVVHPTWVDKDAGWVIRPVLPTLEASPSDALRGSLEASLSRTNAVLGAFIVVDAS